MNPDLDLTLQRIIHAPRARLRARVRGAVTGQLARLVESTVAA